MAEQAITRRGSRFNDLKGSKFGRLLVLSENGRTRQGAVNWLCRCDCGIEKTIDCQALLRGLTLSCGCYHKDELNARRKDLVGQVFGRLTVLSYVGQNARRNSMWRCQCECGKVTTVIRTCLVSGHTKSCGCLHARSNGEAANGKTTAEYRAWAGMIQRCENPKARNWHDWGGRGITVCDRWRKSYQDFLEDVGRRPSPRHSLDRYPDNDGNYEPGNVRWATIRQQANNKRKMQRRNWRESAKHAYSVVQDFEDVVASYTGAPYAVSCDSCTAAILLACQWLQVKEVEIPRFTYCSVPMSIIHAGGKVKFRDEDWQGMYKLEPYPIYDSARLMTSGMYIPGTYMCLSFHWHKHLPIGRGGAILTDNSEAVEYLKRTRFDGRDVSKKITSYDVTAVGWHFNLTPPLAAQGLMLMAAMKEHNEPLPRSDYSDLSLQPIFGGQQ